MNKDYSSDKKYNIVDIFSQMGPNPQVTQKIIRIVPETDGIEMLYSNDSNPEKLYTMKILCWCLDSAGHIDAMVPWLTDLVCCQMLDDPLNGQWRGYYDKQNNRVLYEPPLHKIIELESSHDYYKNSEIPHHAKGVVQEIPDHIGTHATFKNDENAELSLQEVVSWCLDHNGTISAMIADRSQAKMSPILTQDSCLKSTKKSHCTSYFFHYIVANKIKNGDAEVMKAFNKLKKQ